MIISNQSWIVWERSVMTGLNAICLMPPKRSMSNQWCRPSLPSLWVFSYSQKGSARSTRKWCVISRGETRMGTEKFIGCRGRD